MGQNRNMKNNITTAVILKGYGPQFIRYNIIPILSDIPSSVRIQRLFSEGNRIELEDP